MSNAFVESTSGLGVRILVEPARKRGLSPQAFRRRLDVSLSSLESAARIPTPLARNAAQQMSLLVGDPLLGLNAIEEAPVGTFGLLEQLVQNSATWGQGLVRLTKYFSLVDEGASPHLTYTDSLVQVVCRGGNLVPVVEDLLIGSLALRAGQYWKGELSPIHVKSAHSRRGRPQEYERVIGAPVQFDSECTEIVFSRETLALRQPDANPMVAEVIEGLISGHLSPIVASRAEALLSRDLFMLEAELAVRLCIERGAVQLGDVARAMGTSPRSLQRHLRRANSSLRRLTTEVKARFLSDHGTSLSKAGMAGYLGYSDRRTLRRARAKWKSSSGC
ncbi:MAG: AraC family transcriptional regulator ligand-binding domain-containing protein [Myxococcota bacterium]